MRRISVAIACYALVVACVPASMLLVFWMTPGTHEWMRTEHAALYRFLFEHVDTLLSGWAQYFAIQTLAALIAIATIVYWVGGPRWPGRPGLDRRFVFPGLVAGYTAWAGLSYFWSAWPYGTRAYFIRELPFFFLCGAAAVLCGREKRWLTFAKVFVAAAFVQAVLQSAILLYMAHAEQTTLWMAFQRYAVLYSNRNAACAIVLTAAFIVIGFAIADVHGSLRGAEESRRWGARRALFWVAVPVVLGVFAFMFVVVDSLAGKVAAAVGFPAYGLAIVPFRGKRFVVLAAVAAAGIVAIAVIASEALWTKTLRVLMAPEHTTQVRVVDWLACKELYVRRPVQGWGMGTFPATSSQFQPVVARRLPFTRNLRATHPHSEFARIAADQGMVGLLLYAGILVYAFAVSYVALRDRPPNVRLVGYALWAGGLAFLVHIAFGKEPMMWGFATGAWLVVGVLASAAHWLPGAPPAEPEDEPLRVRPGGWAVAVIAAVLVGWGWWTWAVQGYASMVAMNRAKWAQLRMHLPEVSEEMFSHFREDLELARPRCLWADEVLHDDYVIGWYETRHNQWADGAAQLEKVLQASPDLLDARLLLGECYLHLGRSRDAVEQLTMYLAHSPYLIDDGPARGSTPEQVDAYLRHQARYKDSYELLAAAAGLNAATAALEQHVYRRLQQEPGWIVEDYATAREVRRLLDFYAQAGRWGDAHALVSKVAQFFRTPGLHGTYDASNQVRLLARAYRVTGRMEEAQEVEAGFPEAFRAAAPARK